MRFLLFGDMAMLSTMATAAQGYDIKFVSITVAIAMMVLGGCPTAHDAIHTPGVLKNAILNGPVNKAVCSLRVRISSVPCTDALRVISTWIFFAVILGNRFAIGFAVDGSLDPYLWSVAVCFVSLALALFAFIGEAVSLSAIKSKV